MNTRLILFEGIPGSGKTTLAQRTADDLQSRSVPVQCYQEGQLHPADLAWIAYLLRTEYDELIQTYPQHAETMTAHTEFEGDRALVAYTKLGFHWDENPLMTHLQQREIYNGKLSPEEFLQVNRSRWENFARMADTTDAVYVFECVYLQNHINELLAFHQWDREACVPYFKALLEPVKALNPLLIYLNPLDIPATIDHVATQRRSDNPDHPDWIDLCNGYVADSPYGQAHHLTGLEGSLQYFDHRVDAERYIIEHLDMDKLIIDRNGTSWDVVFQQVQDALKVRGLG